MRIRPWLLLCLCSVLLAAPLPALAAHPDVEAGKKAFLKGEFRGALARLGEAQRSPTATEEDLVDIHWYRGASYYALGKKEEAARSFDELLAVRPLYTPNKLETPPDVRAAFKKRAEAYQKANGVSLGAPALEGATVTVPLEGKKQQVAKVRVFARAGGEKTYKQFEFPVEGGQAKGTLNDEALWELAAFAGQVELVLEAQNLRGTPVARSGDAVKPVEIGVTEDQARAALDALKPVAATPAETTPAPAEKPAEETKTAAAPVETAPAQDEGGGPLPAILGAAGGGFLVLGGIALLGGLVSLAGTAASLGAFAYAHTQLDAVGAQVNPNWALFNQLYLPLQVAGGAFGAAAGVSAVLLLVGAGIGVALLVVRGVVG